MKNAGVDKTSATVSEGGGIVGRVVRRMRKPAGSAPGTLIHTGDQKTERVVARVLCYDELSVHEGDLATAAEAVGLATGQPVTWIEITGLHDVSVVQQIGEAYSIHPLVLEDILSPGQRSKTEEYESSLFIVFNNLHFDRAQKTVTIDQVSIVLGKHFVLSFQERPSEVFEPIRRRIREARGKIRQKGPDYLAYAAVDAVVDNYFKVLEEIGDEIEELEELVLNEPTTSAMHRVHALKREVLLLRKAVWPLREMLGSLYRNETPLIEETTRVYLRDTYDHSVEIIDAVETFRDLLSGTMDLYLSSVSNRMNEVMKVLTIIATIFIPLSFFTGVYGMNFEHMPELKLHWTYPALLSFMTLVAGGMLWYFRRKRWL